MLLYKSTLKLACVIFVIISCSDPIPAQAQPKNTNQLYEMYAEALLLSVETAYQEENLFQNKKYRAKVKGCFVRLVKQNVTVKEIQEIFTLGTNAKDPLEAKLDRLLPEFHNCLLNGLQ
jgi:hypothetical protein